jgi:hypothetical protein
MMRSGHAGSVSQSLIWGMNFQTVTALVRCQKKSRNSLMPTTSTSNRQHADTTEFLSEFSLNIESSGRILQLLRSNEKVTQHIQQGMQFVMDAACDAEELKMENKVIIRVPFCEECYVQK